jgi:hypothetical protein
MTQNESTEAKKGFEEEILAAMKEVEALSTEERIDRGRNLSLSMDKFFIGFVAGLKEKRIALEDNK